MAAGWYRREGDALIVSVYAQPGARRTEIQGLHDGALKIRVAAPPMDGRANEELVRFLAEMLRVPVRDVRLISGEKSRSKRFLVECGDADSLSVLLGKL